MIKKSDYIVIFIAMGGQYLYDIVYPITVNVQVYHDLFASLWSAILWACISYLFARISNIPFDKKSQKMLIAFGAYYAYRTFINIAVSLRCLQEIIFNVDGSHDYYRLMRSNYYLDMVSWLLIGVYLIYLYRKEIKALFNKIKCLRTTRI